MYSCTNCEAELTPEYKEDTEYQFDNALWLTFHGGYGMFVESRWLIDDSNVPNDHWAAKCGSSYVAVICHECAHRLCEEFPGIKKLLNPHSSHSHKMTYHDEYPDHWGWDYERRTDQNNSD